MSAFRTLFDLSGAGLLTVVSFGLPISLGVLGVSHLAELELVQPPERVASMVISIPARTPLQAADEADTAETAAEALEPELANLQRAAAPIAEPTRRIAIAPERERSAPPASPTAATPKPSRSCEETDNPDISGKGGGHFVVKRTLVNYYAGHLRKLDALGWAEVSKGRDGKAEGFRIGGLRCGNDAHEAGLRNGDVIHAVNGRAVKNIPQALLVYAKVRGSDTVEVEVTRKGQRRTLKYSLV